MRARSGFRPARASGPAVMLVLSTAFLSTAMLSVAVLSVGAAVAEEMPWPWGDRRGEMAAGPADAGSREYGSTSSGAASGAATSAAKAIRSARSSSQPKSARSVRAAAVADDESSRERALSHEGKRSRESSRGGERADNVAADGEVGQRGHAQSEPQQGAAWEWGGEKKVASSGKSTAKVDAKLKVGEIYVSFSDRKLYYVVKPGEAITYPIAIPREQDDWQGVMRVSDKRVNPSWTPTPTMIKENPRLPSYVPGGHPFNPMGVRALYLGSTAYRIHGTDAPWTIGQPVSKGCIRLYNKDIVDLYDQVKLGARVTVTWDSFVGGVSRRVANKQTGVHR